MENARCPSLLRIAATKAASSQFFLAGQIERFRILRGLDEDSDSFSRSGPQIVCRTDMFICYVYLLVQFGLARLRGPEIHV